MSQEQKPKVLISAYACEPHKGSEPGVGWNWAKQIATFAKVWVVTRTNNREIIEEELYKKPVSNLHFIYVDLPKWMRFWKKGQRGVHLYYYLWQFAAYRVVKRLNDKEQFDVVHHLTFGNLWVPTFMPFLPIPFIWGPIGGGELVPKPFRQDYPIKAKAQEFIRDIILSSLKINPLFWYICKKASLIIVRTNETLKRIPQPDKNKTIKMIETGIETINFSITRNNAERNVIQVISVGRLIHWKGFDLTLKAFAKIINKNENLRLIIIGDGKDKERLLRICKKEKISDMVCFTGHINHEKVLQLMSDSSIFLFPSLKEGGAWVFFEAMLLKLPIICLEIAGATEIVDAKCGIKVKPNNPEQTINDLSKALLKLANDSDLRRKMGQAGRKRVEKHYTWDKKGEFIKEAYKRVLEDEDSLRS